MKKFVVILGLLFFVGFIAGCNIDSPTYVEDNFEVRVEFVTLFPNTWIPVSNVNYRWYQEIPLTAYTNTFDYTGIICYYLNEHSAWEALPSTRLFWLEDGTVYTDEIWYSHDDKFIYIDYRNTIPNKPATPKDPIKLNIVYFYEN